MFTFWQVKETQQDSLKNSFFGTSQKGPDVRQRGGGHRSILMMVCEDGRRRSNEADGPFSEVPTLYIGITSNLLKRVWEHKNKIVEGFTKKYNVTRLVYYECYDDPENAILREKRLKKWKRQWKIELIEAMNPEWKDLAAEIPAGACP